MSYSQALEQQMGMLHFVQATRGIARADVVQCEGENGPLSPDDLAGAMAAAQMFAEGTLTDATPYYWSPEICELIDITSSSLPAYTLRAEDVPTPVGFCWFPRAVALLAPPHGLILEVLCVEGDAVFPATARIIRIDAISRPLRRYPYGAGVWAGEAEVAT